MGESIFRERVHWLKDTPDAGEVLSQTVIPCA